MKAQHNYTTAMTTAIRLRWGMATLLILAALIVGLMLVLRTNGQSTISTSTKRLGRAPCRSADRFLPRLPRRVGRGPGGSAGGCCSRAATPGRSRAVRIPRQCTDRVLPGVPRRGIAAQTVQPAVAAPVQRPQAAAVLSISRANALIASCRVCRDEWIRQTQSIRAAIILYKWRLTSISQKSLFAHPAPGKRIFSE